MEFELKGAGELLGRLESIKDDIRYKGGRFALRKAAQVIRDAAKQNAAKLDDPTTAKNIANNIIERWNGKLFKQTGDLGFRVGVKGGAKEGDGETWYFRFLEFGTEKQAATPFMRPAIEQNIDKASSTFISEYHKALDRAIKRAAKKAIT